MLEGEGFRIQEDKFDFFFGRVTSSARNQARSLQNLRELERLGIREEKDGREQLMQIFHEGLTASERLTKANRYGTTITRVVEINNESVSGDLEVSYFYRDGDLDAIPEVVSLIPRIYRRRS